MGNAPGESTVAILDFVASLPAEFGAWFASLSRELAGDGAARGVYGADGSTSPVQPSGYERKV